MSPTNQHRLSSEMFKLAALAITNSQSMLSKSSLTPLKEKLESSDATLDMFDEMQNELKEDDAQVNVLRFFAEHQKMTDLAQGMSKQLSNTNKKVEEYLAAQFQKLFT